MNFCQVTSFFFSFQILAPFLEGKKKQEFFRPASQPTNQPPSKRNVKMFTKRATFGANLIIFFLFFVGLEMVEIISTLAEGDRRAMRMDALGCGCVQEGSE